MTNPADTPREMKKSEALLRLARPAQWIKNFFVFAPIIFGGALFNVNALAEGILTFFAFSFAASSIYCFNDIHDVADDRRHPEKCHRPIASGAVSVPPGLWSDDSDVRLEPWDLSASHGVAL